MKRYTLLYSLLAASLLTPALRAEGRDAAIRVSERSVARIDSLLQVDMTLDISGMRVPANRSVVCTPLIERGDSLVALPPVVINGRDRHILYQRLVDKENLPGTVYRRLGGEKQVISYQARVPYRKWMGRSEVSLVTDLCGCGWEQLREERSPLFPVRIGEPVTVRPRLVYRVPLVEAVKSRALRGSAFLDFPVNRTEIHPDYRKNPRELAAIRATIDSVRLNRDATITEVSIKGYASPEGGYANNTRLAKGRSEALLNYIKGLYDFGDARMSVTYEPEDWAGLERAVEESSIAGREELLAIIRADGPHDWDRREQLLKRVEGGAPYRYLLAEVYPALRHSDYSVNYTIRHYTVDEAKVLLYKDPSRLSLNEMFQVAQTYGAGTPEFNEVFEIAVRVYPDDPVSNLNAANTALNAGKLDAARRYLAKAGDSDNKRLAEASLLLLEGKLTEAEPLLEALERSADTEIAAAACDNIAQLKAKREELKWSAGE